VGVAQAAFQLARVTYERDRIIASREPGAVSPQQLDQDRAQQEQAQASVNLAQANLETARLNLNWTRVTAPIDGQVSRYYLTVGNLVTQDQTLLTTIVSLDPMYAYFDVDERTVLRVRRGIAEGTIQVPPTRTDLPVYMGLEGEEGFPHRGTIDFINNQFNPTTATMLVRGEFANPVQVRDWRTLTAHAWALLAHSPPQQALGPGPVSFLWAVAETAVLHRGRRLLAPGMFVRIRVPIGQPHPALLVIDRAVGSDQGLRFVYLLDGENRIDSRRVTTGPLESDGLRVISGENLRPDDRVVVSGLQQVRPRMVVEPDLIPMPTLGPATSEAAATPQMGQPQPAGPSSR
jgi:multidrug efflux system membrane fusion protein